MTSSPDASPMAGTSDRGFRALLEWSMGFLLAWMAVTASYRIEAVRAHYPGMTSFAPLGFILLLLLSPAWLGIRHLLRRHLQSRFRPVFAFWIPTIIVCLLSLMAIFAVNKAWMLEPIY